MNTKTFNDTFLKACKGENHGHVPVWYMREVTGQYLQHPVIARDFANYLELYYRYRKEYGVSRILAGDIPEDIRGRIRYAPFDERLQIIALLHSSLGGSFRQVRQTTATKPSRRTA